MLLAPSFSPKVQTVLDCLFNAVRALAGRTCPSTSGSFSHSVVLAMPEEACEAPLASQAAGAPQGTHCQPRGGYSTLHACGSFLGPWLAWAPAEGPCPSPFQLPLAALWAAVPYRDGHGREQGRGSPALCVVHKHRQPCPASLMQSINNHRHLGEPHGTGSSWAFLVKDMFSLFSILLLQLWTNTFLKVYATLQSWKPIQKLCLRPPE